MCCLYVVVKYLREITPFFKKTSSLSDIGWDDFGNSHKSTSSPTTSTSTQSSSITWSEKKTIPLTNCYVCQNLSMIDRDQSVIEIHAPDGQSSCFLKCPDKTSASAWFNSIVLNVSTKMQAVALPEANKTMAQMSTGMFINHMGWLAQQVGKCSLIWLFASDERVECVLIVGMLSCRELCGASSSGGTYQSGASEIAFTCLDRI